jgi:hypothetical protein
VSPPPWRKSHLNTARSTRPRTHHRPRKLLSSQPAAPPPHRATPSNPHSRCCATSHHLPRFPCMGLSKSSKKFEQRHLSSFPFFLILLFAPSRAHPSVPPAVSHGRRAQGRSRIWPSHAVQHTHGISRPLLDGPRARREARDLRGRRGTAGQPNPQRRSEVSLAGVARKIAHHVLVFGRSRSGDLNHDAVIRIGGEAPRRQTHSSLRHRSHGNPTSDCHLGSSWHSSRWKAGSTPDLDWAR